MQSGAALDSRPIRTMHFHPRSFFCSTIIRGIDRTRPFAYRVVVGSDIFKHIPNDPSARVMSIYRVNSMDPVSGENLNRFIRSLEKHKEYALVCGVIENNELVTARRLRIIKRHLAVRDAWQIGPHDVDVAGIQRHDDPIIPKDQIDPPVLYALQQKKERSARPNQRKRKKKR